MSGWRREGCGCTPPDLNTLFPARAMLFATMSRRKNCGTFRVSSYY
jgi:hypothetical protein